MKCPEEQSAKPDMNLLYSNIIKYVKTFVKCFFYYEKADGSIINSNKATDLLVVEHRRITRCRKVFYLSPQKSIT